MASETSAHFKQELPKGDVTGTEQNLSQNDVLFGFQEDHQKAYV